MWYGVVEDATGRLASVGTVVGAQMPDGYSVVPFGDARPDFDAQMWDASTRAFVARPPKAPLVDRLDDIASSPVFDDVRAAVAGIGNATQRQLVASTLRTCLTKLLKRYRYRRADEPVELE